jgi:hypothetical protein
MIFDWPASLVPSNVSIRPPRRTVGLNSSLSNFTQATPAIRPPFGLLLEFDAIFGSEVLAWRAMEALFEGRTNRCRVPLFDLWFRASDAAIAAGAVTHSDGTAFSDGALYLTNDLDGVTVTGAQGDRTITADFGSYGEVLQGGLYFGLAEHPYIARRVWWEGSVATIECAPTLRTSYAEEPLKLRPTMIAGLLDDDGANLMLRRGRFGGPSLALEERFA